MSLIFAVKIKILGGTEPESSAKSVAENHLSVFKFIQPEPFSVLMRVNLNKFFLQPAGVYLLSFSNYGLSS